VDGSTIAITGCHSAGGAAEAMRQPGLSQRLENVALCCGMPTALTSLHDLNNSDTATFTAVLGPVFEHAPWIAEGAAAARPFATVSALHDAMMAILRNAPAAQQMAFVRGHPELASKVARAGTLTAESTAEQGSLGLNRLSDAEASTFESLNSRYAKKFGFPCIICVRRHTRDSILRQFERRLTHAGEQEFAAALEEIGHITRLRLSEKITGPGMPETSGRLSTHVLDTYNGRPAAGVAIALYEVGASARGLLKTATTNGDGRTDTPLIAGEPLRIGTYELQFSIGDYFRHADVKIADPPFLDIVPVRFSIAEPEGHYHVPLVTTPWSYSTYRGS
jgi:2-oxo-4-hydroxy-4-carboxy-5-ureidoimidazoline decarboxylase